MSTTETLYALNIIRTYWPDKGSIAENSDLYNTDYNGHIIVVPTIEAVADLARNYITDILRFEYSRNKTGLIVSSFRDYTIEGLTPGIIRLFEIGFSDANDDDDAELVTYILRATKVAYQKP